MPAAVEVKVMPILEAWKAAMARDDAFDAEFDRRLANLLQKKDKTSREAQIALMDYYLGEHNAEDLLCTVASFGTRNLRLLNLYSDCDIEPSVSPLPRRRELTLRLMARSMIISGRAPKSCETE